MSDPTPSQSLPPATLTRAELARELRTTTKTVDRWTQAGKLPAPAKIGRRVLYQRDEIVRWVAAGSPSREAWTAMQASRK